LGSDACQPVEILTEAAASLETGEVGWRKAA
jgi:hypothetical protein